MFCYLFKSNAKPNEVFLCFFVSPTFQRGTKTLRHHFGAAAKGDATAICVRADENPLASPPPSTTPSRSPSPALIVNPSIPPSTPCLSSLHVRCRPPSLLETSKVGLSSAFITVYDHYGCVQSAISQNTRGGGEGEGEGKRLTCSAASKATAASCPGRPRAWRARAPARAPHPAASAPPRSWAAAARSAGRPCARPRSC